MTYCSPRTAAAMMLSAPGALPCRSYRSCPSTRHFHLKRGLMNTVLKMPLMAILLATASLPSTHASAQVAAEIAAPDTTMVGTFHAEGAQLYECKREVANTPSA